MATSGSHKTEWTWLLSDVTLTFSWNATENKLTNSSMVDWGLYLKFEGGAVAANKRDYTIIVNGITYTGKVDINTAGNENKLLVSGSTTIPHDKDGSKIFAYSYELQWEVFGDSTPTRGGESTGVLDAIDRRAVITSLTNFTDETNPVIYFNNFAGNDAETLQLGMTIDNTTIGYRNITDKTSNSYNWALTSSEKTALYKTITNNNFSKTVTFILTTIIGSVTWYSSATSVFSLVGAEPTLSPIVTATDARTKELTGDSSGKTLIRYFSDVQFNTGASASKGATIDYQTITNGGKVLDDYTSNTGTIENVTSNTFYFSVTDSRGLVARDAVVFSVDNGKFIEYIKLTNSIQATELTANGELTFTIKGKYFDGSFGAKNNSMEVEYSVVDSNGDYVFNSDGSGWVALGDVTPSVDSNNNYTYSYTITGLDYQEQYELSVNVIDEITPSITSTTVVSTTPLFDWGKDDFRFNIPVYLKDATVSLDSMKDFVIEDGTNGTWFYRKWKSGRVELYGYQVIPDVPCNTALGSMYRTEVQTAPSFPFTVYSPKLVSSYESDGYGAFIWNTTRATTAKPPDYYLVRPTSSTHMYGRINYHVQGYWK